MAKVLGLAHIGIHVSDVEVSKKFYMEKLDMEFVDQAVIGDLVCAFLRNGSASIELVQNASKGRGDGVIDHISIQVDNLDEMMDLLKSRGIEFITEVEGCPDLFENGNKWVFFLGPDGERIEITETL